MIEIENDMLSPQDKLVSSGGRATFAKSDGFVNQSRDRQRLHNEHFRDDSVGEDLEDEDEESVYDNHTSPGTYRINGHTYDKTINRVQDNDSQWTVQVDTAAEGKEYNEIAIGDDVFEDDEWDYDDTDANGLDEEVRMPPRQQKIEDRYAHLDADSRQGVQNRLSRLNADFDGQSNLSEDDYHDGMPGCSVVLPVTNKVRYTHGDLFVDSEGAAGMQYRNGTYEEDGYDGGMGMQLSMETQKGIPMRSSQGDSPGDGAGPTMHRAVDHFPVRSSMVEEVNVRESLVGVEQENEYGYHSRDVFLTQQQSHQSAYEMVGVDTSSFKSTGAFKGTAVGDCTAASASRVLRQRYTNVLEDVEGQRAPKRPLGTAVQQMAVEHQHCAEVHNVSDRSSNARSGGRDGLSAVGSNHEGRVGHALRYVNGLSLQSMDQEIQTLEDELAETELYVSYGYNSHLDDDPMVNDTGCIHVSSSGSTKKSPPCNVEGANGVYNDSATQRSLKDHRKVNQADLVAKGRHLAATGIHEFYEQHSNTHRTYNNVTAATVSSDAVHQINMQQQHCIDDSEVLCRSAAYTAACIHAIVGKEEPDAYNSPRSSSNTSPYSTTSTSNIKQDGTDALQTFDTARGSITHHKVQLQRGEGAIYRSRRVDAVTDEETSLALNAPRSSVYSPLTVPKYTNATATVTAGNEDEEVALSECRAAIVQQYEAFIKQQQISHEAAGEIEKLKQVLRSVSRQLQLVETTATRHKEQNDLLLAEAESKQSCTQSLDASTKKKLEVTQDELRTAQEANDRLEETIRSLRIKVNTTTAQMGDIQTEYEKAMQQKFAATRQNTQLELEVSEAKTALEALKRAHGRDKEEMAAGHATELCNMQRDVNKHKLEISELQKNKESEQQFLQRKLDAARQEKHEIEEGMQKASRERMTQFESLSRELEQLRSAHRDLEKCKEDLQDLRKSKMEVAQLKTAVQIGERNLKTKTKEYEQLKTDFATSKDELEIAEASQQAAADSQKAVQAKLDECEVTIATLEGEKISLETANVTLTTRLKSLSSDCHKLQKLALSLKRIEGKGGASERAAGVHQSISATNSQLAHDALQTEDRMKHILDDNAARYETKIKKLKQELSQAVSSDSRLKELLFAEMASLQRWRSEMDKWSQNKMAPRRPAQHHSDTSNVIPDTDLDEWKQFVTHQLKEIPERIERRFLRIVNGMPLSNSRGVSPVGDHVGTMTDNLSSRVNMTLYDKQHIVDKWRLEEQQRQQCAINTQRSLYDGRRLPSLSSGGGGVRHGSSSGTHVALGKTMPNAMSKRGLATAYDTISSSNLGGSYSLDTNDVLVQQQLPRGESKRRPLTSTHNRRGDHANRDEHRGTKLLSSGMVYNSSAGDINQLTTGPPLLLKPTAAALTSLGTCRDKIGCLSSETTIARRLALLSSDEEDEEENYYSTTINEKNSRKLRPEVQPAKSRGSRQRSLERFLPANVVKRK